MQTRNNRTELENAADHKLERSSLAGESWGGEECGVGLQYQARTVTSRQGQFGIQV